MEKNVPWERQSRVEDVEETVPGQEGGVEEELHAWELTL